MNIHARFDALSDARDVQVFDLPRPISTNALFANVPGRGRIKSERYRTWLQAAGWTLKSQHPRPATGPVELTLILDETCNLDLTNSVKCVEDLLVAHCVIPDDSKKHVRAIHLHWGSVSGVRVFVEPAK